jgi:hypothetical protein
VELNCTEPFPLVKRSLLELVRTLELQSAVAGGNRATLEREVVGSSVVTVYNNRTYIVESVNWDETPLSKFSLHRYAIAAPGKPY